MNTVNMSNNRTGAPLSSAPSFFNGLRWAVLGGGLLLSASCQTQRNYDEVVTRLKDTQGQMIDKDAQIEKLTAENAKLKRDREMTAVSALDSAYGGDVESRLSELQQKIDGLGRPLQDIEKFQVEGGYVLMVQDKILFDSGSSDLSAEGKKALDTVSAEINQKSHGRIWVRGHTDNAPVSKPSTKERFPHGNLQLSAARAIEVAAELTSTGKVDAHDIVVVGYGQFDPIRPNDNAENKRLNRRVEIFVSDKGTGAKPAASGKADKATQPKTEKK
jgi:chemotaxis protein MotB